MTTKCKYGEFEFPADKGFTGSAGKTMVRGYARGGAIRAPEVESPAMHQAEMAAIRRVDQKIDRHAALPAARAHRAK